MLRSVFLALKTMEELLFLCSLVIISIYATQLKQHRENQPVKRSDACLAFFYKQVLLVVSFLRKINELDHTMWWAFIPLVRAVDSKVVSSQGLFGGDTLKTGLLVTQKNFFSIFFSVLYFLGAWGSEICSWIYSPSFGIGGFLFFLLTIPDDTSAYFKTHGENYVFVAPWWSRMVWLQVLRFLVI